MILVFAINTESFSLSCYLRYICYYSERLEFTTTFDAKDVGSNCRGNLNFFKCKIFGGKSSKRHINPYPISDRCHIPRPLNPWRPSRPLRVTAVNNDTWLYLGFNFVTESQFLET